MEKARILIVEDETVIALGIEGKLQSLGYEVTSIVNTGEKAIEKAESEKPDLIIMDIRLKGEMDGIDAAEIIRNKFGIPVIFSTAYLDQERIERAKITMPFGYLLKPIQERDLKVTLEMALYVAKVDTERRKAEDRFKIMFEDAPLGVALVDSLNGKMLEVNKKYTNITGRSKEEMETIDWMSITHPDDVQEDLENMARLNSGAFFGFNMNKRFLSPHGSEVWVNLTVSPVLVEDETKPHHLAMVEDITEQKKSELALKESEIRLKQAQKLSGVGHWDWFLDTGELTWSDETYEIFGRDKESFEVSAESFEKTIHPDDFDAFAAEREKALAEKRDINIEHRIVQADGSLRHVHEIAEIIRDEKGEVIRVMGVVQDITELKNAESAKRESERLLREVINSMEKAIAIYEPVNNGEDFRFVDTNKFAEKIMHYKTEDVVGKTIKELFPREASIGLIEKLKESFLTGKSTAIPLKQYQDDRITQWVENYIFKLPSGKVVAMFEDTTKKRKAKE